MHLVLGIARHAQTNEKLVVYIPLGVSAGTAMKVLPYREFTEEVTIRDTVLPKYLYLGAEINPVIAQWYDELSGYRGADRVDG